MSLIVIPLISVMMCINFTCFTPSEANSAIFSEEKIGELPASGIEGVNKGVAGAFSGIFHHHLVIAGGNNFPGKAPWEGGIKVYHDKIYLFDMSQSSLAARKTSVRLPEGIAYGASISLPEGVLCIGGNGVTACSAKVFLIKWDESANDITIEKYPELPVPLSYTTAALLDNFVYVVGGSSSPDGKEVNNYFFRLDLSRIGKERFDWQKLAAYPGLSRILGVSAAQSKGIRKCLFLFGGRNTTNSEKPVVMIDGLVYDPGTGEWSQIPKIQGFKFQVMAGSAFPWGSDNIVLVGGAPDSTYLLEQQLKNDLAGSMALKNDEKSNQIRTKLLDFYQKHKGFSSGIMVYNTNKMTVSKGGDFKVLCPVTTNAIPFGQGAIITCGEIKPGIRTPDIYRIWNRQILDKPAN